MSDKNLTKQETTPNRGEVREEYPVYRPRVDIVESAENVVLRADMPGVDEKSVDIDLHGTQLTIRGTFMSELPGNLNLVAQEYRSGSYERSFTLGNVIDRESISATMKDGVLHLVLPKAKEAQPRRIEVAAG